MENLPPGTIPLAVFGLIFFLLQAYWISQTIKGLRREGLFKINRDPLKDTKEKLEKLLKK
ncbi:MULTISPECIES: hypothetical protein [Prochlorococcus]|uniref:Uncharacterized protein n=1 Tax=Prochlorococcus marinus (strain SARG / CCMP1375 / SS120) TaxID=167539 RepID=Q7VCS5_PROMA|nr:MULTISPECIES: hypothetical protein [Prochlorococcus]AAP99709.1 Predicted protein [Prochlorococcus marinus subsp. marinus str. CCMP1375]KGG13392.1 hypothetical protein EV04_0627 [Prochlorococcus marinus str. LG]KGG21364.1 hypothetical protein EV08_0772 [Prochlorococcus marinus str. SS2]KGG24304.1 hypothetical protein EV09_0351 [Prochlorococcus marinus str. SS35]KGG33588.1 hypothetical protein EV10_0428 [Prochlorococcus marinus str. SS51]